ncbi:MAG: hypothetical protein AAF330_02695 [Pseudomonadota bacterium]
MRYLVLTFLFAASTHLAYAKTVDCYCTDTQGSRVELGQTICLFVDGNAFMAQCQMSLNNPMWRRTGDACVTSELKPQISEPGNPILDATAVHSPVIGAEAQS